MDWPKSADFRNNALGISYSDLTLSQRNDKRTTTDETRHQDPIYIWLHEGSVDSFPLNDTLRDPMLILNVERNGDVFPVII